MKKILTILILLVAITNLKSQTPAEKAVRAMVVQEASRGEKIYLVTDQDTYLTGEYMWFSVFVLNRQTHEFSDLSKVAYIEILDANQQPVLQTKIALNDGRGDGSVFLPASLVSSGYSLRAYTRWMTNFSPANYFSAPIRIINPFVPLATSSDLDSTGYEVRFLPEGGTMVNGHSTKMAFRVTDKSGTGIPFRGMVRSDQGDTVALFSPLKFGMGHFVFTPEAGKTYTATIKDVLDKTIMEVPLPEAANTGHSLSLHHIKDGLRIDIRGPEGPVYLALHKNDSLIRIYESRILTDSVSVALDQDILPPGMSRFLLLTPDAEPLAERAFFRQPDSLLTFRLLPSAKQAETRDKMTVNILSEVNDTPVEAFLTASVYREDPLSDWNEETIISNLWLTSDLEATVEHPEFYFSNDREVKEAMDNLMLVYGWTGFRDKPEEQLLAPEVRTQLFGIKVTDPATGKPVSDAPVYLSLPGKPFTFKVTMTDKHGKGLFELSHLYGNRPFILQMGNRNDSTLRITPEAVYSLSHARRFVPAASLNPTMKSALESRSLAMQMENIYSGEARSQVKRVVRDTLPFYAIPEDYYLLDDYVRFPSMLDVMKEYVPEVAVRKRNKDYIYRVLDREINTLFDEDPLILLDGVPVSDVNKMIRFDPLLIERLDVVPRRYILGPVSFAGIVSYSTYTGELEGFDLPGNAVVGEYDAIQLKRIYYSPVYEASTSASRKPDMRTLLMWAPSLETGNDGSTAFDFYTSDQPGTYRIVVEGLTKDGKPGHAMTTFQVSLPASTRK